MESYKEYKENLNELFQESLQERPLTEQEELDVELASIQLTERLMDDTRMGLSIEESFEAMIDEGIIGKVLGGLTGFALGKTVGKAIAKVLGIKKGVLYDLLTSRLVGAALGASLGKKLKI